MRTVPDVGRSIAAISFSNVLLPAPEWPDSTASSPAEISKLTPASAVYPPA